MFCEGVMPEALSVERVALMVPLSAGVDPVELVVDLLFSLRTAPLLFCDPCASIADLSDTWPSLRTVLLPVRFADFSELLIMPSWLVVLRLEEIAPPPPPYVAFGFLDRRLLM